MANNYKLSSGAYSTEFDRKENYDLTHTDVHKLRDVVNKNYEQGGGFGYICIPKPRQVGDQKSNFDNPNDVECRPAFIPPSLIQRPNDAAQALNAGTFDEQQYFIFPDADIDPATKSATWIPNTGGAGPDNSVTWTDFSKLTT
jgi:hypothetical protein